MMIASKTSFSTALKSIARTIAFTALTASSASILIAGFATSAHAYPQATKVCSNDAESVAIYRDHMPGSKTFYYVPRIKMASIKNGAMAGAVLMTEEPDEETGTVTFGFKIEANFPQMQKSQACLQRILKEEKIAGTPDLQALPATAISITIPEANILARTGSDPRGDHGVTRSGDATDIQYMRSPTTFFIELPKKAAEKFKKRLELGLNVEFTIAYKSASQDADLSIDTSCHALASELGGSINASTTFGGAEVEAASRNLALSTSGAVTTHGNTSKFDDFIQNIVKLCLQPVDKNAAKLNYAQEYQTDTMTQQRLEDLQDARRASLVVGGMDAKTGARLGYFDFDQELPQNGSANGSGNFAPAPVGNNPTRAPRRIVDSNALPADASAPRNNASNANNGTPPIATLPWLKGVQFKFQSGQFESNQVHHLVIKQFGDIVATTPIRTLMSSDPASNRAGDPRKLQTYRWDIQLMKDPKYAKAHGVSDKDLRFWRGAKANPIRTGKTAGPNQTWVVQADFVFRAKSNRRPPDQNAREYEWNESWGDAADQLYYRIGDGSAWAPVGPTKSIVTSSSEQGEIQFYIGHHALFGMIDSSLREDWFEWNAQGHWAFSTEPVFTEAQFYPLFSVEVSGQTN